MKTMLVMFLVLVSLILVAGCKKAKAPAASATNEDAVTAPAALVTPVKMLDIKAEEVKSAPAKVAEVAKPAEAAKPAEVAKPVEAAPAATEKK